MHCCPRNYASSGICCVHSSAACVECPASSSAVERVFSQEALSRVRTELYILNNSEKYQPIFLIANQHVNAWKARYCYNKSVRPSDLLSVRECNAGIASERMAVSLLWLSSFQVPPLLQNFKGSPSAGALNTCGWEAFAKFAFYLRNGTTQVHSYYMEH